ncbi:hypothetical protein [Oceanidesulfovibrio marinus]|uniref:hypothetical protein n=1 Tax=Oceanidesulfovibrio marinus TaxID=370038 RepID=UPI001184432C|nr:hypothetical protein [Oceanidesulfovibrio marinus]
MPHETDYHPGVHPDEHPDMQPITLASILGCTLACTHACKHPTVHPGVHPDDHAAIEKVIKQVACEQGFSLAQINIISVLLSWGNRVISYSKLADELRTHFLLNVTKDAVRGYVYRLKKREVLSSQYGRLGSFQGAVYRLDYQKICPHIVAAFSSSHPCMHPRVHPDMRPAPSNLDKIEEKNLSICSSGSMRANMLLPKLTDDDFKAQWPNLASCGFGCSQLRQIYDIRQKIGNPVDKVIQGLNYAEFELANDEMKDAKGNKVVSPNDWVFTSLRDHGAYRRPKGYISITEQNAIDDLEESKRIEKIQQEKFDVDYSYWRQKISDDMYYEILGTRVNRGTQEMHECLIRDYYRKNIFNANHTYCDTNKDAISKESMTNGGVHFQ